jgi:ribosomal protein L3 glutamine methyltransferase
MLFCRRKILNTFESAKVTFSLPRGSIKCLSHKINPRKIPSVLDDSNVFSKANTKNLQTIFDIYRFAVSQFHKFDVEYGHSTTNAYEDASFLIQHELALPIQEKLQNWSQARLCEDEKDHLLQLIKRRCLERIPISYLVNGCYQQGHYFYVDERVLIPRSYIGEILVNICKEYDEEHQWKENAIKYVEMDYEDYLGKFIDETTSNSSSSLPPSTSSPVKTSSQIQGKLFDVSKVERVLDLCTGSGCLAILAAKLLPHVKHIDAIDISTDALEVARYNVENHQLIDKIQLRQSDLFNNLNISLSSSKPIQSTMTSSSSFNPPQYDLILCNPPYVTTAAMSTLPPEYQHEPCLALQAGRQGIDLLIRIIQESSNYLTEHGGLLCEIGQTASSLERIYGSIFARNEKKSISENHCTEETVTWIATQTSNYEMFYASKSILSKLKNVKR